MRDTEVEGVTTFWQQSHRFDPRGALIADRHYNRRKVGSPQFVPPGSCLVLRHGDDALWVTSWPITEYVRHAWAGAWMNSLFRKEGNEPASDLIREAVAMTLGYWPEPPALGMVTFVDASKVRSQGRNRPPGYTYGLAGFEHVGFTQGGLWVWQMLPDAMPEPIDWVVRQGELFA